MKVLILEPDPINGQAFRKALAGSGDDVTIIDNGHNAINIVVEENIRMVVANCSRQVPGGFELVRELRAAKFAHPVFILMLANRGQEEDVRTGMDMGVDDVLIQPFSPNEFKLRVELGRRIIKLEDETAQAHALGEHLAGYDSLTDLMNRSAIYQHASNELERARRSATSFSLIMLDIDNFKAINEQYGHQVGDELLQMIARTLRHKSRPYDGLGRWAGDKFLICQAGVMGTDAEKVANRMLDEVSLLNITLPKGGVFSPHISAGVASIHRVRSSAQLLDALIQRAEEAVLNAKRAGGNQVYMSFM